MIRFLPVLLGLCACGTPVDDLVILEVPLARNTALAEIKSLHVELFPDTTACNTLVRLEASQDLEPVAAKVLDLTGEERRNGANRYVDNLPLGSWNIRIQAFGEDDLRVGYACEPKTLEEGASIVIEYVARERRRPPGQ